MGFLGGFSQLREQAPGHHANVQDLRPRCPLLSENAIQMG